MGLKPIHENGETKLEDYEIQDLIISSVTTRMELDRFEQQNIERALKWTMGRKINESDILSEAFIKLLHKKMFGMVWSWAGTFRKSEKNIGVSPYNISIELRKLLDDSKFWILNNTYPTDEIAIRFKHRIVQIHCFVNGNGRHSRLMADLITEKIFRRPVFSWGSGSTDTKPEIIRSIYLQAIRAADQNNFTPLLAFARS